MFKKADIILAVMLILLGGIVSYMAAFGNSPGSRVLITVAGEEFGTYSLEENRHIIIDKNNHSNEVTIKDGNVSMFFSDCSNQVCVKTGAIWKTSQSVVCLPNKVMVQILGEGEPEYDAISN